MNKAPLTSVENTFGDVSQMDGKSPRKLTVHEKDVINGLKQLTKAIFKPHFRHECVSVPTPETPANEAGPSTTSNDSGNLFSLVASSAMAKENKTDLDSLLEDVAGKGAEHFCAMVLQQLNTNRDADTNDDWHSGQLHAYSSASQRMFEATVADQTNAAHANVRRQLNEF